MATPKRPAAMPSDTSLTSVMAVKDVKVRCKSPLCEVFEDPKYGPYVYKLSEEMGEIAIIDGDEYMVKKVHKKYLDPYGFSRPIPRPPPPCWFCASADVSFNRGTLINNEPRQIVGTCSCSCCPFSHIQCRPEIRCKAENDWYRRERIRHERLARKYGWKT